MTSCSEQNLLMTLGGEDCLLFLLASIPLTINSKSSGVSYPDHVAHFSPSRNAIALRLQNPDECRRKGLPDPLAELGASEAAANVAKPFLPIDLEIASFLHHSAHCKETRGEAGSMEHPLKESGTCAPR